MKADPKNILLVSQFLSGGGLERMVHLLGKCLVDDFGCNVTFYSFDNECDRAVQKHLIENFKIQAIHEKKSPGFSRKTVVGLLKIIREKKIQIIHTHETAPLMYAVIAKVIGLVFFGRYVKLIHTQHSFIHLQKRSFIRHYDRSFQYLAKHLTVVSPQVRDEYEKIGVPPSRVRCIDNGVEFPKKLIFGEEQKTLRGELITERLQPEVADFLKREIDAIWMMSMARVHPKKGQDRLIGIWGELPEEIKRRSLMIFAGPETEPGEVSRLKALLKGMSHPERVIFLGSTTSPVRWLQASDIFLSGSEYEGMPLAPIEACGAGLPLVLSSIEGHRLLGNQARYFTFDRPAEGAAATADCIAELTRDPQAVEDKSRKNAAEMQRLYSIQQMTRNYYDLYCH